MHFNFVLHVDEALSLSTRYYVSDIVLDSFLRLDVLAIPFYFIAIFKSDLGEMCLRFVDELCWLYNVWVDAVRHVLVDHRFKDDCVCCLHEHSVGVLLSPVWNEIVADVVVVLCHNDGPLAIGNHRDFSDIDATVDLEVDFDLLGALDVLRADDSNVRL